MRQRLLGGTCLVPATAGCSVASPACFGLTCDTFRSLLRPACPLEALPCMGRRPRWRCAGAQQQNKAQLQQAVRGRQPRSPAHKQEQRGRAPPLQLGAQRPPPLRSPQRLLAATTGAIRSPPRPIEPAGARLSTALGPVGPSGLASGCTTAVSGLDAGPGGPARAGRGGEQAGGGGGGGARRLRLACHCSCCLLLLGVSARPSQRTSADPKLRPALVCSPSRRRMRPPAASALHTRSCWCCAAKLCASKS